MEHVFYLGNSKITATIPNPSDDILMLMQQKEDVINHGIKVDIEMISGSDKRITAHFNGFGYTVSHEGVITAPELVSLCAHYGHLERISSDDLTEDMVTSAVHKNPVSAQYIPETMLSNTFVKTLIDLSPHVLSYLPSQYKDDVILQQRAEERRQQYVQNSLVRHAEMQDVLHQLEWSSVAYNMVVNKDIDRKIEEMGLEEFNLSIKNEVEEALLSSITPEDFKEKMAGLSKIPVTFKGRPVHSTVSHKMFNSLNNGLTKILTEGMKKRKKTRKAFEHQSPSMDIIKEREKQKLEDALDENDTLIILKAHEQSYEHMIESLIHDASHVETTHPTQSFIPS